jgi:micrococcal nuclease
MSELCPQCGAGRNGDDAFCSKCGYHFPGAGPVASTGPRPRAQLTSRQKVGAGVLTILALALIGNLGKQPGPSATATEPSPPPAAAVGTPTLRPATTPWATVKPAFAPTGDVQEATVARIVDGDTIVVDLGGKDMKVRYIGMDTPEVVDPESPVEPMGPEAAAANERLVGGKTVYLERDVSETDRYGRLLRYVWLKDGGTWTLVNLELVRLGLAKALSYPPDTKYDGVLATAQTSAERSFVGLWDPAAAATPNPTAPPTPKPTPKPTPRPTPKPTPKPTKKPSSCHPSYTPCLPIVADLDCPDVRAMGKAPVEVIGPDDYRLDRDHDGLGCE